MTDVVLKQRLIEAKREIRILRWFLVVSTIGFVFTLTAKILEVFVG